MQSSVTGKAGLIVAPDEANCLEKVVHSVADDALYNILHDLLLKVHLDEKTAKANTAAILIEKLAGDSTDTGPGEDRPDTRVETDSAIYCNGEVYLKGNPLKTTGDILCPHCHLPRLLHPTDGNGARKPDPSVVYCKRAPYIEKPGFDIYGQTWIGPGPGRGKKRKETERKSDQANPSASDSPTASTAEPRPPNVLAFPSITCSKCKHSSLVTRLNKHMSSCIGNSGRNASRAAAQKISNGNGHGNGNADATPPSSQKGTPVPGSRASSPKKRRDDDLDDDDDDDESTGHRSKKPKHISSSSSAANHHRASIASSGPMTKRVVLKTKGPLRKGDKIKKKFKTASALGLGPRSVSSSGSTSQPRPAASATALYDDDPSAAESPALAPRLKFSSGGSPLAKVKSLSPAKKLKLGLVSSSRPPQSSPLSRSGIDADADSASSDTLSSPRG